MACVCTEQPITYRLIEYIMGKIVDELITNDFNTAQDFYMRSCFNESSVRAYVNGKRLLYLESDQLFGYLSWKTKTKRVGQ